VSKSARKTKLCYFLFYYYALPKQAGTYYHWDTTTGSNIKGNVLGVDIELTPSVSFELGQDLVS
jgi:hypothetical protein